MKGMARRSPVSKWAAFLVVSAIVLALAPWAARQSGGPRGIAGSGGEPAPLVLPRFDEGVLSALSRITEQVRDPSFGASTCGPYLQQLVSETRKLSPREIRDSDLQDRPQVLVEALWELQLALHSRIPALEGSCQRELRDAFRLVRFLIDYLGERAGKIAPVDPSTVNFKKIPIPILQQAPQYGLLTADGTGRVAFEPGDLMVARGVSYLSALISRIGSMESQFSHIVFVDRDPETRRTRTIESYVGEGVRFFGIETALRNENPRLLLLRSRDPALAERAARFMRDRVSAALAAGKPIPYDYRFDFEDHSALSCAEVATQAYQEASAGGMILPTFRSLIDTRPDFLERFDLRNGATFEPGDMEIDPHFDLVAEFRDLSLTRDSRTKDVILSSLLRWVKDEDYVLVDTLTSKFAGNVIWPARRTWLWPLVRVVFGVQDFSKEVPRGIFRGFALLNQVSGSMLKELRRRDAEFEKKTGWAMTYVDLSQELESMRKQDLEIYINPETRHRSRIHFALRPRGLKVRPVPPLESPRQRGNR